MAEFAPAFEHLMVWEGGWVNDPNDPGGETKYGISKRSYPGLDIAALTRRDAETIYFHNWWQRLGLAYVGSQAVATKVLSICVNVGARRGVKLLQWALRACGEVVEVDGWIGPRTINATNRADEQALLAALKAESSCYYRRLRQFDRYGQGWLNRAYA